MKALLINNKEIIIDDVVYIACPELEEFQEYTVVSEIENIRQDHPNLYEIEESERWLLKQRFVPLQGLPAEVPEINENTLGRMISANPVNA